MQRVKIVHRLPKTNIVIDYWKPSEDENKFIRFMSVFRLTKEQCQYIKENDYKIYTSTLNRDLLEHHEISAHRIVAIEPQSTIDITDEVAGYSFKVSVIDSNYCIGSCMFLFRGPFGNILYTGFFRPAKTCDPLHDSVLEPLVRNREIDVVYIDNSYAAEHCEFPSRADVIEEIINFIEENPHRKIIISGKKFGKEEILRDIATSLNEKIGISKAKYRELFLTMMRHHCLKQFNVDQEQCRIIVEDELFNMGQCKNKLAKESSCIIILLTAQYICEERLTGIPAPRLSNMHILPYSSHASHSELMNFLYNLKARHIEPIILSQSENTIIPQKMLDLRFTDEDSVPFQDSDFHFESCTDAVSSGTEVAAEHEMYLPILNSSPPDTPRNDDNMNDITLVEETCNTITICPSMRIDRGGNMSADGEETDSTNSGEYHEAETSAFRIYLEAQGEEILMEGSDDFRDTRDPLSLEDISGTDVIRDSLEAEFDMSQSYSPTESIFSRPQDGNVNSSTHKNDIQSVTLNQSSKASDVEINSTHKRMHDIDGSPDPNSRNQHERKRQRLDEDVSENQLNINELNSDAQASSNHNVFCEEISSRDTTESEDLVHGHNQSLSCRTVSGIGNPNETDGSDLSLSVPNDYSDYRPVLTNYPSGSNMTEEEKHMNTVLYHYWLKITPENCERTEITVDTWKDLPPNC